MTRNVVTIDPAVSRFAYAVFHDDVLVACGYARTPPTIPLDEGRWYEWVLEKPRKYARFAVAHKNLEGLDKRLRAIRRFARERGEALKDVRPSEWKGNVPKHIHHARSDRALAPAERALLRGNPTAAMDYEHDVWDAVAIGLTELDRIGRGGRLPTVPRG